MEESIKMTPKDYNKKRYNEDPEYKEKQRQAALTRYYKKNGREQGDERVSIKKKYNELLEQFEKLKNESIKLNV